MDEKELQKLYGAVSKHFNVGEYNSFRTKMSTPEQRKSFYNTVTSKGFDIGDYDSYEKRIGIGIQSAPTDIISQAAEAGTLAKKTTTVSKLTRKGDYYDEIVPDQASVDKSKEIKNTLAQKGVNADLLIKNAETLKYTPEQKEGYTKLAEENPVFLNRKLAHDAWKSPLLARANQKIQTAIAEGDIAKKEEIEKAVYDVQNLMVNADYITLRGKVREGVVSVRTVMDDNLDGYTKHLADEASYVYGKNLLPSFRDGVVYKPDAELNLVTEKDKAAGINAYQKAYLDFVQDTNPGVYEAMKPILNPIDKRNKDDYSENLGYEEYSMRAEGGGLKLAYDTALEELNNAKKKGDPKAIEVYTKEVEKLYGLINTLEDRYPLVKQHNLSILSKEVNNNSGTAGGFVSNAIDNTAAAFTNTAESVWDIASYPFRSEENYNNYLMSVLGDKKTNERISYLPQDAQTEKTFEVKYKEGAKEDLEKIKKESLSEVDMQMRTEKYLRENPDAVQREAIDPESNITAKSMLYGVSKIASDIAPYILVSAATGGAGAGFLTRELTAGITTMYHGELQNAIDLGDANPMATAFRRTAINSLFMAGGGTAGKMKELALGASPAVKNMIMSMTDDAIEIAIKEAEKSTSLKVLNTVKDKLLNSAKSAATLTPFIQAGQITNKLIDGEPVNAETEVKHGLTETLKFFLFGAASSAFHKTNNVSKLALYEAVKSPETFLSELRSQNEAGKISGQQLKEIENNITTAKKVYDNVLFVDSKGNPLNETKSRDLLALKFQEQILNDRLKKEMPETVREKTEAELNEVKNEANNIIDPVQPTAEKPKEQEAETAVPERTNEIGQGGAEAAAAVLEEPVQTKEIATDVVVDKSVADNRVSIKEPQSVVAEEVIPNETEYEKAAKNIFNEDKITLLQKLKTVQSKVQQAIDAGVKKWGSKKGYHGEEFGTQSEREIDVPDYRTKDERYETNPEYRKDFEEYRALTREARDLHTMMDDISKDLSGEPLSKLKKRIGSIAFNFHTSSDAIKTLDAKEADGIISELNKRGMKVKPEDIFDMYEGAEAGSNQLQQMRNNVAEITDIIKNKGLKKQQKEISEQSLLSKEQPAEQNLTESGSNIKEMISRIPKKMYRDVLEVSSKEDIETTLSDIAEQYNGSASERKTTIETFGKEFVDYAVSKYPESKTKLSEDSLIGLLETGEEQDNKGLFKKVSEIEEATDPYYRALQHFANGGKINPSAIIDLFGGKDSRVRQDVSTEGERRSRIGLMSKKGLSIDDLAHSLWESDKTGKYDTQDYRNAIEEVLLNHNSRASMAKSLIDKYSETERDLTEAESDLISKEMYHQINEAVKEIPENIQNELVALLDKYTYNSKIDWNKLEEESNGFNPDFLNLSPEASSAIEKIIKEKLYEPAKYEYVSSKDISSPANKGQRGDTENEIKGSKSLETGIKHKKTAELREKFNLPEYERVKRTKQQEEQQATEKIKNGEMPDVIEKMRKGIIPDAVEQRMFSRYLAEISDRVEKEATPENLDKLHEAVKISDASGTEQSLTFSSRKDLAIRDESLAGFLTIERDINNDVPLTEKQVESVKAEWEKLNAAKLEYEGYVKAKEAELAAKEAEAAVNSIKKDKVKKDYKGERETLKEKLKRQVEEYKASISKSGIVDDGGVESFVITTKMAKTIMEIVKSHVAETGDKLAEVTSRVIEEIKDFLPNIKDTDIHDVISGKYNEPRKTKNQIAEDLYNLRYELKLVRQLEALKNGGEPKKEKEQRKYNENIYNLKNQIKELKEADTPERQKEAIENAKKRIAKSIAELDRQLREGDYEVKPRKKIELDKEGLELKDKLIKLKIERQVRLMKEAYEKRSLYQKTTDWVVDKLNIPRTIMASADLSAPFRQGLLAFISNPVMGVKAMGGMFEAAAKQKTFDRYINDLRESEIYHVMNKSGLAITDPHSVYLAAKEEAFMNNTAEKIPFIGRAVRIPFTKKKVGGIIKGSERAYVYFLNRMRAEVFTQGAEMLAEKGKTFENSPDAYKALAKLVNAETGRGNLPKALEGAAPILNSTFFSPRLIASRVELLTNWANPIWYKNTPKEIRMMYAKDMARFIAFGSSIVFLASLSDDAEVETDPRSTDFMKIKSGNTRWDIWGGFQQYIRFVAQFSTGEKKAATSSEIKQLDGEGAFGETRGSITVRFLRGKLAPVPASVWNLATGKNLVGEEANLKTELYKSAIPLIAQDLYEAYQEEGTKSFLKVGLPAVFGIGVGTYTDKDKNISPKINYRGVQVELEEEAFKEHEEKSRKYIKENLEILKKSESYKKLDNPDKLRQENIVTNIAIKKSEEEIVRKYRRALEDKAEPLIKEKKRKAQEREKLQEDFD